MKERPILFSTPMVNAILEGKKTVTRRIVKFELNCYHIDRLLADWPLSSVDSIDDGILNYHVQTACDDNTKLSINSPFGKIGDRLWVRETWCPIGDINRREHLGFHIKYKADSERAIGTYGCIKWKPSIFMPRWASRINLEITDVKCERLLDIKEVDAIKEGFFPSNGFTARGNFLKLFGELNGNESITNNVFVWVIEFVKL